MPRHLGPAGLLEAPTQDAAVAALDNLKAAASLDDTTLSVTEGGGTRFVTVRRQDEVLETWITDTLVSWSLGLTALDPRKYGPQVVASTGLPQVSGGLTWPVTWPMTWSGVAASGVVSIDNPGNITGPIVIRIDGPCTGPILRHDGTGAELVFSSTYDLPAGSWLTIDMERRTILEGDTASRNGFVTDRGWFGLEPGHNDIIFDSQAYNSSALMTVTTAPAYL
jgi:hypothetical protein